MIFEINFIGGPMDLRRLTLNQEHEPARFYEVMDYPPLLTDKPSDDVSREGSEISHQTAPSVPPQSHLSPTAAPPQPHPRSTAVPSPQEHLRISLGGTKVKTPPTSQKKETVRSAQVPLGGLR